MGGASRSGGVKGRQTSEENEIRKSRYKKGL